MDSMKMLGNTPTICRKCYIQPAVLASRDDSLERLERVKGIEPSCAAWEAAVLPLNYTRLAPESLSASG
jgi:DNA topoisomerase IB